MSIYVTGDIHGRPNIIAEIFDFMGEEDITIIAGDFGDGFLGTYCSEERFYDYIAKQNKTILFIDGNHEHFDHLNSLPISTWNGGRVHKIRDNIIHCIRGEVFNIQGKSIFTFGGGYSLDKDFRSEGINWWPEENIQDKDRENAESNLNRCNRKVDYCISHTAPMDTVRMLAQKYYGLIKANVTEEYELTNYLQYVADTTSYDRWFFGHFHIDDDRLWHNHICLLDEVRDIETGESVYTRKEKSVEDIRKKR